VATATTATSLNLGGLSQTTQYDWRVRANCSNGFTGIYTQAQFTTTTPVCGIITGAATSAITTNTATISWSSLNGAANYDVDYKDASSVDWINIATATTVTSADLAGLTASTLYEWRVRANCTNGLTGEFKLEQFTTAAPPTCDDVTGLASSAITAIAATVNWQALGGAASYDVDYKKAGDINWTNAVSGIPNNVTSLTGLTGSTLYDWRVRAKCTNGATGNYTQAQFTTLAPGCPDIFEPNNTLATAKPIATGVNYDALIALNGDNDYYSFNNTLSQLRIKVTLTNLPANYDMKLFSPAGRSLVTSALTGTTSEKIIYNASKSSQVGTYKVYVYGRSGAFHTTNCYRLLVQLSATNFTSGNILEDDPQDITVRQEGLKLFPVPASESVTVSFDAANSGSANIFIINQFGSIVLNKTVTVGQGINFNTLNTTKLPGGVYTVKVIQDQEVKIEKLVIQK